MAVLDDIKFGDSEAGAGAPIRLVFHLVDDARTTSVLVGLPVVEYGTSHVVRSGGRSIKACSGDDLMSPRTGVSR